MKTRTLHRALSMLLTAAMVLNMGLTPVFAEGITVPGVSGVCTHHTEHTADCGYKQGTACKHEHTEDCYTKELTCTLTEGDTAGDAPEVATDSDAVVDSGNAPAGEAHTHGEDCYTKTDNCKHEHSADCGYTPDSPCRFDAASCTQCNPGEKQPEQNCTCEPTIGASDTGHGKDCPLYTAPECTCPPVDSGEQIHGKDCPLYTAPELSEAVKALIAMVDVLPNAADITEDNKEATLTDFEAAAEAYGALSEDDKAAFDETPQHTKLMALRDVLLGLNTLAITTHPVTSEAELTAAIADAATGDTIQLAVSFNFANNITFPAGKALILDLNGKTLTGEHAKAITIAATAELTITDSGSSGTLTRKDGGETEFIVNRGILNINSGTILVSSTTPSELGVIINSGTFSFTGGNFLFNVSYTAPIYIVENNGGDVRIDGMTLETTERVYVVRNFEGGKVDIKNSTIRIGDPSNDNALSLLVNSNGEATMTNCTISASGRSAQAISNSGTAKIINCNITNPGSSSIPTITNNGNLEITGGKLSYTPSTSNGLDAAIVNNKDLTIHSGVFTSTSVVINNISGNSVTINDGTFVSTSQIYPALRNGTYTVNSGIIISAKDGSGNTAVLLNKVHGTTTLTENVNIPSGKTFTVLVGASLTIAPDVTLSNSGTLDNLGTVTNNGTVRNRGTVNKGNWFGNDPENAGSDITVGNTPDADYTSIYGAWSEAGNPATITLTSDVSFSDSLIMATSANKNITLDLNGHTLEYTGNDRGIIVEGSSNKSNTLTFEDGVYIADGASITKKAFSYDRSRSTITLENCLILGNGALDAAADAWKVHGTATLYNSYTLAADKTLTVPAGATLTIPAGVMLTNNGTIVNEGKIENEGTIISSGTLSGSGAISGSGAVQTVLAANMITLSSDSYVYTGSAFEPTVTVASTPWTGAAPFVKDTDFTVGYSANTGVGTATVTVTPKGGKLTGSAVDKTFTITQSDTAFTGGIKTYKDTNEQSTFTYGDTITVKVTAAATGTAPAPKGRAVTPPTDNGMALFLGSTQLTEPQNVTSGIELTFTLDTTEKQLATGENAITAKYVESTSMAGHEQTITVTLNKKVLTGGTITPGQSKPYDGTVDFSSIAATFSTSDGVVGSDAVTATVGGTVSSSDVNSSLPLTVTSATLGAADAGFYLPPADLTTITGNVAITAATPTVKVTAAKKAKSFFRSIGDHNDTITLTATTGGENGEKPNGSVVFKNGDKMLDTVNTTNGVATYDWANPPAGNITVTAEFTASNSNYISTAVTGTADAFDIDKGAQSALTVNVPSLTYGDTGKSLTTSGGSTGGIVTYNVTGDCVTVGADGAITVEKAGTAKVTATMAGNENFNAVTSKEEIITVNPATPTISWGSNTAQTVTYTGTEAVLPNLPTVTGIAVGDTSNGAITYQHKSTATKLTNLFGLLEGYTAGLPTNAGEYKVIATVAADGNYAAADSAEMTLTIEKSTPTLTIDSYSGKDYDGTAIAPPTAEQMTITGAVYDDVKFAYSVGNGIAGGTDTPPTNADTYNVWASVADGANTNAAASVAVSFTIEKAPLTITGGTVTQREYDGTTAATVTELTFYGLKNGETLEITTDYTAGTPVYDSADAGTNKTVSGTAVLESNAKTSNYTLTGAYSITNQTIAKKTGIAAPSYTAMDNTGTTKSFTFGTVSGYDTVTDYEWKLDTDADSAWASVTTNPITFGNRAGKMQVRVKGTTNYEAGAILTHGTAFTATLEGSVSIDGTATYGETLTAKPTGTQTGAVLSYEWKSGTTVLQAKSTSNTYKIAGAAVGNTITVEVTAASYTGSLTDTTATVEKKEVTATATTISKVYDGTTAVETADQALTITKVNSGDDITVTMPSAVYNNANADTGKAITVGNLTITGAAKAWYTVTAPSSATGEITAKPLANSMISGINASYPYTGSAIAPTPTVTDGGPSIITTNDYTVSHEDNTDAGTAKVILTGKGNYSGTAEKTFTISKATGSIAITGDPAKTYNGTAVSEPAVNTNGSDGAVTFEWYEGSTLLAGAPKDAGSYTVKAIMAAGTNHTAATATKDFAIAKAAAPDISYPTATGLNYGAKLSTSALTGGSTYGSFAWEDGNIVPAVTNSGYSVKFTPSEATLKNYEPITPLTQKVSVTVAKSAPAIDLKAQVSGDTSSRQATLTATLTKVGDGEIPTGTVKFVNSTSGTDVDITGATAVSITNGVATYTWTGLADQAYKVKAVYSGSDNYQIATATEISFDTRKQNQQNFAIAAIGTKTYGDGAFTLSTSGGNGSGVVSFTSSDPATVSISGNTPTIHKAGNVTITANKAADDSYNEATATASLTVNKKAISFIANDMPKVVKGSQMPTFTYKPVALATGDSITTEPTLTTTAADTNTLGKFAITISGAVVTNADSYTITYINGEMTVVEQLYTVTVTDGTGGGQYSEGQTVSITANDKNGYTFSSWSSNDGVTFADSNAKTTTFTMLGKNVTVTANYNQDSTSGGGTGGGGGGGVTPAPDPKPETPTTPTTAESNVNSKTDKNGNATAAVAEKDITNAIDKAQKEAKKNGTEKNGIAIVLNVKTDKNATTLGVTLPQKSVSALITANVTQVTVKNGLSTVTLDLATLKTLAGGDVILSVKKADTAKLSKEAQAAIGNRPVFQYSLTSGDKTVSDFKGGRAGLQVPYTLSTTEQAGNLCGVYVDASGKVNWLEASSYDPITGVMLISAQHFSTYGIGYKQSTPKFTDVGTHWAKNDIDFVVARGLLSGTSNTTFAPETSMTRGMFVTALGRLAGVDTKKYSNTKFTDVAATAYYSPYVAWASANSIVTGTSDTTFSPDKAITRQEMAVMLVNYSKAIGYKLPSVHAEVSFTDAGSIASWAKDAVKQTQMAGILMGKSGNRFDPTATATRAEVSAMLRRYVELVVNTETAEGWAMNESGQWLYIENGKRVTGNKTIDGKSYTFDQYGVTTALPPERKYLAYTVQAGDSFWSIARKYKVSMFELAKVNGKTIFSVIQPGEILQIPEK